MLNSTAGQKELLDICYHHVYLEITNYSDWNFNIKQKNVLVTYM